MSGGYFDDPNREAVGVEPAWAEGFGGAPGAGPAAEADAAAEPARPEGVGGGQYAEPAKALDDMTKAELIEYAEQTGAEVDESMTKAQIREAIGS